MRRIGIAIVLLLAAAGVLGSQDKKAAPATVALEFPVTLDVPAGPLTDALESIRKQVGLRWAVLPELLPANVRVEALTFSGPLSQALDRFAGPLQLKWQVGEFGSIVLLPKELPLVSTGDWISKTFETTGLELIDVEEFAQELGFRSGDVMIALNGERVTGYESYRSLVLRDIKPGQEMTLTVRRGGEDVPVKAKGNPRSPIGSLGIPRYADVPSESAQYLKAGHRDPAWDAKFQKVITEIRGRDDAAWDPGVILQAIKDCAAAGCRDPLLPALLAHHIREFSVKRWDLVEQLTDPAVLRTAYGGSRILTRGRVAADFLFHGSPALRDRVRPLVEAAWAATKDYRIGVALAAEHFMRADDEACLRMMAAIRGPLRQSTSFDDYSAVLLESQALQRLGRYDDALESERDYARKLPLVHAQIPVRFHESTLGALKKVHARPDRLTGEVGLLTWKAHAALDAILGDWKAGGGHSTSDTGPGRYSPGLINAPVPTSVEAYFFPKMIKTYESSGFAGSLCFAFGAAPGQPIETPVGELEWTRNTVFRLNSRLDIYRAHGSLGFGGEIPLPGFTNGYQDTIRFFKTPDFISVRCNGSWITTDAAPCLANEGWLAMAVTTAKAFVDAGVLIATTRPYDNDRIRTLMERIPQPGVSKEERLKLWYEAASLSPPGSVFRRAMFLIPREAAEKAPPPKLAEDAPPLTVLTADEAIDRLQKEGEAQWVAPDPVDPDLVWRARSDGSLDQFSRVRFFTTTIPPARTGKVAVGKPVFLKDSVWVPTDRGLFRLDRAAGVLKDVPLGGLISDVPLRSLALEGDRLRVGTGSGKPWTLNLKTGAWEAP